jgi:hypothetical protein
VDPRYSRSWRSRGDLDGNGSLDYRFTWTTILGASGTNTLQLFLGCRDTELPFRESYP